MMATAIGAKRMIHPYEGMWAPWQARQDLRHTFDRWLSHHRHQLFINGFEEMIDDSKILDLCQHYRLEYLGSAKDIETSWDTSEQRIADSGPSFNHLVEYGWIHFDGGRWMMMRAPIGTQSNITYPSPSTESFLTSLDKVRLVAKFDTPPPDVKALADKISTNDRLDRRLPTKMPERLASRLWELLCPKLPLADPETIDAVFLEWLTWCDVLGVAGKWDLLWDATEMRYCRDAAQRVLQRQTLWGSWDNDVSRYTDVLTETYAISKKQLPYHLGVSMPPPQSLVSRVDFLSRPEIESLMMGRHGAGIVSFAFNLLCSELETTDVGPDTANHAATVLLFAGNHPMGLQQLLYRINTAPALLVDMLLTQHAACLATRLIIEWRGIDRGADRKLHREAQTKAFAVEDALSLLAYHRDKNTLDCEECASLISWCYAKSTIHQKSVADSRKTIGQQLLVMLSRENEAFQSAVLKRLLDQMTPQGNRPSACFAAALDGLIFLSSSTSVLTRPIVDLYSQFACAMNLDWTDASILSAEQAARLIAAAIDEDAPVRDTFFVPFDSQKLLRQATGDEQPSLNSSIARTLRIHVRMLARAINGWSNGDVPEELFKAFESLISRSVIEHAEKGRIGALTDRYNLSYLITREDASPAQDIAAAWRRLNEKRQECLLQALIQSDDPVLLAELCLHLPAAAKPKIQLRLQQLSPDEASRIWSWPELERRVGAFLIAGEYALARTYLDQAQNKLSAAPQEFQLGFFNLDLRLLLKEKHWDLLDNAVVPSTLKEFSDQQAKDLLDFYKATSQLLRPDGNLAQAHTILEQLASRPGAASAYKENAIAAAIHQLVGPTLHPLTGSGEVTGNRLLAEISILLEKGEEQASNTLLRNRAWLLIALRKPEEALNSISVRRQKSRSSDLESIAALAMYELGAKDQAIAILDAALSEFGDDEQLNALKKELQTGVTPSSSATASVFVDMITNIRAALQQLAELQPIQLGNVLGPPGQGLRGYLTRQVSRAVASLQHMAAMLRDRKNPANEARFENDLNSAVREVLGASLSVAKWDVCDQSLGGATANGTPGERDAVIRVSGQEISIYEALVCSSLDRTNLKRHFDRLLSYGICDIYFHVTYSYLDQLQPLLDYVREMLEHETPTGLRYLDCEQLGPPNFETSGYLATYQFDHREIAVVFLVADLKT